MQRSGRPGPSQPRESTKWASAARILFYGICVPVLSLFITLPLLVYLDDDLKLFEAGSSGLMALLVFVICLFSTGWAVNLLDSVANGRLTRGGLQTYVKIFLLGNGVATFWLVVVIAVRHRYDISVEAFFLVVAVGFPLVGNFLVSGLFFLVSRASKWPDHLRFLEKSALESFEFLNQGEGYSEPVVEIARDLSVAYKAPERDLVFTVDWERGMFVPGIYFRFDGPEGRVTFALQQILGRLGITVDPSAFPLCERMAHDSRFRDVFVQLWRKHEILLECPRFLEAYGSALRTNHGAVLAEVRRQCDEPLS